MRHGIMPIVEDDQRAKRRLTTKATGRLRHGHKRCAALLALVMLPLVATGCQLLSPQPEGKRPRTVSEFLNLPRPGASQPRPGSGVLGP